MAACAVRQVPLFNFSLLNWVNYSLNKNTHSKCLRNALCMARLSEELEKAASDPIRAENRKSCNPILVNAKQYSWILFVVDDESSKYGNY